MNEFVAPPTPVATASQVTFSGQRPNFRRLVVRGAMLELVTVGFYRFWLATDIRRHLWSNTAVDGDTAEYTGTAKELLIGFLFALAILVPIYLAYFFAGLEAERLKAFASIPLVLFYYLFSQFAIYRARRYRLSRTVWRGVRFWMTGSGLSYAWRAALWSLLALVSLGFALPWRAAALERFKMRHSYYGELRGRFDGTGWQFLKRGWWLWLLALLTIMVVSAASASTKTAFFIPLIPFAFPFLYAAYKAVEWRWWISGIRIGEVRFESDLPAGALIGLYWKLIGWIMLFVVVLLIWMAIVGGIVYAVSGVPIAKGQEIARLMQQLPVLIALGFGYVVEALVIGLLVRIYLIRDLWARVAASTTVHNLAAAENVAAMGTLTSALGEGFADSLDVAGF
jgi:uncharacterized membrane protein YjgN (DUF898 family)